MAFTGITIVGLIIGFIIAYFLKKWLIDILFLKDKLNKSDRIKLIIALIFVIILVLLFLLVAIGLFIDKNLWGVLLVFMVIGGILLINTIIKKLKE